MLIASFIVASVHPVLHADEPVHKINPNSILNNNVFNTNFLSLKRQWNNGDIIEYTNNTTILRLYQNEETAYQKSDTVSIICNHNHWMYIFSNNNFFIGELNSHMIEFKPFYYYLGGGTKQTISWKSKIIPDVYEALLLCPDGSVTTLEVTQQRSRDLVCVKFKQGPGIYMFEIIVTHNNKRERAALFPLFYKTPVDGFPRIFSTVNTDTVSESSDILSRLNTFRNKHALPPVVFSKELCKLHTAAQTNTTITTTVPAPEQLDTPAWVTIVDTGGSSAADALDALFITPSVRRVLNNKHFRAFYFDTANLTEPHASETKSITVYLGALPE